MKLSIITINYNNCKGLSKTIDSVISQTWQDFEWIIVDGGSTDGSRELIEQTVAQLEAQGWTIVQFSGPEDPIAYIDDHPLSEPRDTSHSSLLTPHSLKWCSERDKGIYNAMNKGIVRAQGDFCLFLNSGDRLYEKSVLNDVVKHICNSNDFYVGRIQTDRGITPAFGNNYSLNHLLNCSFPHQASFINRRVFERYGLYNESYKIVSDWELFIKALVHGSARIRFFDVIVCTMQEGGISNNLEKLTAEKRIIAQTYFSEQLSRDLVRSQSLSDVLSASVVTRKLYSILYRLAMLLK